MGPEVRVSWEPSTAEQDKMSAVWRERLGETGLIMIAMTQGTAMSPGIHLHTIKCNLCSYTPRKALWSFMAFLILSSAKIKLSIQFIEALQYPPALCDLAFNPYREME